MNRILPDTNPPDLPEHSKLEDQDHFFMERSQDFLHWLRWQKDIQIRSDLEGQDTPQLIELLLEYLDVDYSAWLAEKAALQNWLAETPKSNASETQ